MSYHDKNVASPQAQSESAGYVKVKLIIQNTSSSQVCSLPMMFDEEEVWCCWMRFYKHQKFSEIIRNE